MIEILLHLLRGLIIVALVFLGICALAMVLVIVGALVVAVRVRRKDRNNVEEDRLPFEPEEDDLPE